MSQLTGCATPVATTTPAEVVAGVSKNSDIRITWEGPESDNVLFGFPAAETALDRIYEKCRQLQGTVVPVRQAVRFDGPTLMKSGPKPEFVRIVTTEIRCKQGDLHLWAAKIGYRDHRLYEDIQNRKRMPSTLEADNIFESRGDEAMAGFGATAMRSTSIKGQQLRTFLGGNSCGTTSVILEARRPPISSAILRRLREPASLAASRMPILAKQRSSGGLQQSMSDVGAALEALGLLSVARRLDLAGCFVVEVNREQLAALAEVPAIQGIRPNVTRRRESSDELAAAISASD